MEDISTIKQLELAEVGGLPTDLPTSTYEMIGRGASLNGEAPALSFFTTIEAHRHPKTWTYGQLLTRITQTANFFHSLGVGKDGVIAIVLPNLPETHFALWGGEATGIVTVLNPMLEGTALAELLNATKASVLVTLAPFAGSDVWSKLQPILPRLDRLRHLVLVDLADHLSGPGGVRGSVPASIAVHDFSRATADHNGHHLDSGRLFSQDDESSCFCTGGTTGLPKIAVRTHGNEVANAWSTARVLGDRMGPGKVVFCGLPLFHVNGVLVTGLLPFSTGAHVVLGTAQGYRGEGVVKHFWEIVEHHRINIFSGVPTLYAALLAVPIGSHDISSLEYGICGAAPMPVEVFRNFQQRTGVKILEGYGLTEGTCVSSLNPPGGERRLGSIGLRLPYQLMKAVMLDEDGTFVRDCTVDEAGTLVIAGPNLFKGYREPAQNRNIWVDSGDGRRWFNTGDLGRQDGDGYFWLTGRKKELIIRGGHNIDPASIEEPLHTHPAVLVAAAVGRPDAHSGQLPVAYVQLKPGTSVSEVELLEFLQSRIAERAAIPKAVRLIKQMPLTAVGKIFKPALIHREVQDALKTALAEADIKVGGIQVNDHKTSGMTVTVELGDGAQKDRVSSVLGRFPFPFDIKGTAS